MTIIKKEVCICKCNKCGYEWQTRTEKIPKACPNCKSMRWNAITEAHLLKAGVMDASKLALSKERK